MNFEQFKEDMRDGVNERLEKLGIEQRVKLVPVEKSNERHLTGLVYDAPRDNITPCIYIDDLFERFQEGADIGDLIEKTSMLLSEDPRPGLDVKRFMSTDDVRGNLSFRLMDFEKNEAWLSDKVYEQFGDFAKVAYISFSCEDGDTAYSVLKKASLPVLGITEEEALEAARAGTENQPVLFQPLNQYMSETMGVELPGLDEDATPIYLLSNTDQTYGAALITNEGLLKDISEQIGGSFYVLPSSVHEVLIAPMNGSFSRESLSEMVRQVNAEEVSKEDFLSDKLQVYSAARDRLMNAESYEKLQKEKAAER